MGIFKKDYYIVNTYPSHLKMLGLARQIALWKRAIAPISSSNNLERADHFAALFFLELDTVIMF